MTKLNLGSGAVLLPGFINIDVCKEADLKHDLTKPLPFADNSVDYIYSEHFIEHLTYQQGTDLLKECYRVLRTGGAIRIATPDLYYLVLKYLSEDWRKQKWLEHPDYAFIDTPGKMLNASFYHWGHKRLYDYFDLGYLLLGIGFRPVNPKDKNKSGYIELSNLETRDESLIMEAIK